MKPEDRSARLATSNLDFIWVEDALVTSTFSQRPNEESYLLYRYNAGIMLVILLTRMASSVVAQNVGWSGEV